MRRKSSRSPSKDTPASQVSWTDAESDMLLDIISTHKASAGDGLNFKMTFWNTAAAQLPGPTKGAPKTAKACKERWQRMKKTFDVIERISNASGLSYSRESGASVGLENEMVWADFVKKNKHASPFRNKGWPHYEKMKLLMPSKGKGLNRFSALSISDPQPSGDARLSTSESETQPDSGETFGTPSSPPREALPATDSAQADPAESSTAASSRFDSTTVPQPAHPLSSNAIPPPLPPTSFGPTAPYSTQTQAVPSWHPEPSYPPTAFQTPFSPPSVPSSFNGSAISSIKPTSSVSARMAASRKRPADDEPETVVSACMSAAAASSTSSSRKRRAANTDIVREIGGLRSDINNHLNTFESTITNMSEKALSRMQPGSGVHPIIHQARQRFLQLDSTKFSPPEIAALFRKFQHDHDFSDGYLLLADGFEAARLEFLQQGIGSTMANRTT